MTITTAGPDLTAVKAKQQKTWSSGDFAKVASTIVLSSERLADSAQVRAGSDVLDVACGSGNATIAAARNASNAVGVDYVPALIEVARSRAEVEGLSVDFRVGDAEDLPAADDSFDTVLSVFGAMFAPDHYRTASEMSRVARAGGTVALASWTPDGFIGEMFSVITGHVQPPTGVASPLLWGTEDHVADLFGDDAADISSTEQIQPFRYPTAEAFVDFFRTWYGPTLAAFNALDEAGQSVLYTDLVDLANRWDIHQDGRGICIPGSYLESVITMR